MIYVFPIISKTCANRDGEILFKKAELKFWKHPYFCNSNECQTDDGVFQKRKATVNDK